MISFDTQPKLDPPDLFKGRFWELQRQPTNQPIDFGSEIEQKERPQDWTEERAMTLWRNLIASLKQSRDSGLVAVFLDPSWNQRSDRRQDARESKTSTKSKSIMLETLITSPLTIRYVFDLYARLKRNKPLYL